MTREDVVFLVNPASANGSTGRRWPEIARRATTAGLHGDALMSEGPGQLVDLARQATRDGVGLLVIVGGDGTINEAVTGVLSADGAERPDLAVIPRGTGTDFIRSFRIPKDLDGAIAVARDGDARPLDAGRVRFRAWDGTTADGYFVNIASAGMSGAVAQRANATTKVLGGQVSFFWATLAVFARWRNSEVTVEVDGETRTGVMLDVIVANCEFLAGGMRMCPDARPDDGLFDILLIGDITKRDLVATLPKIYRGTHLPHPKAEALRGRMVSVDAPEPLPIELDGEQPGTTPARFEIIPAALRLRAPASSGR